MIVRNGLVSPLKVSPKLPGSPRLKTFVETQGILTRNKGINNARAAKSITFLNNL